MAYVILLVLFAAVFWGLISLAGAQTVNALDRARLVELPEEETASVVRLVRTYRTVDGSWLSENGFHPLGAYEIRPFPGRPRMMAWRREGERTYLVIYVIQAETPKVDIVTCFGDRALTTGTAKDGHLFPTMPGNWMQTFDFRGLPELWEKHQAAVEDIETRDRLRVDSDADADLQYDFEHALAEQKSWVCSHAFWYARIPYWYFTRPWRLHNIPVSR